MFISIESIKVRLNSKVPPDFVLFSKDKNLLHSISEGVKRHINKSHVIWDLNNMDGGNGFQINISNDDMQKLCKEIKLNF